MEPPAKTPENEQKEMNREAFVDGFITCMLWTESGDAESPLGKEANASDLAEETRQAIEKEAKKFLTLPNVVSLLKADKKHFTDVTDLYNKAGIDYWLTAAGHGVTFDDGDWIHGESLCKAVDSIHPVPVDSPYVGDDGKIYLYL